MSDLDDSICVFSIADVPYSDGCNGPCSLGIRCGWIDARWWWVMGAYSNGESGSGESCHHPQDMALVPMVACYPIKQLIRHKKGTYWNKMRMFVCLMTPWHSSLWIKDLKSVVSIHKTSPIASPCSAGVFINRTHLENNIIYDWRLIVPIYKCFYVPYR